MLHHDTECNTPQGDIKSLNLGVSLLYESSKTLYLLKLNEPRTFDVKLYQATVVSICFRVVCRKRSSTSLLMSFRIFLFVYFSKNTPRYLITYFVILQQLRYVQLRYLRPGN